MARQRARLHFLAGDLPRAILAFREALNVYPSDATLRRELAHSRAMVAYPNPANPDERAHPDPPAELRHRVSPADLFLASSVASALLAVGLAARFTARPAWWPKVVGVGLAGIALVAAASWQIERESGRDTTFAVVAVESTLRTGNAETYSARVASPLPAGAEVGVLGRRGGWVQVKLAGGAVGWLPASAVLISEDASATRP